MLNGVIVVNKEKGFTSHDVVAKLRGILRQKKIGHTGTLDPDATGVLPVCLGNATKLCDVLTDKTKEYTATLLLGKKTDTLDISGKVLKEQEVHVSEEKVRDVIMSFVGESMQIPPMYSALKVNGKKLYEYARAGIEIEREPRPITVFSIDIKRIDLPRVEFSVSCSKGTYIRSLCDDMGTKLGCGGCMESLRRDRVEHFLLEQALTLAQIEQKRDANLLDEIIIPVDEIFSYLPKVYVRADHVKALENGNVLFENFFDELCEMDDVNGVGKPERCNRIRVYHSNGDFYGIYELAEDNLYKPYKMFIPTTD